MCGEIAELGWSPSGEPFSEKFSDVYFSAGNGLAEKNYVFFQQNNLEERFANGEQLIIGETGFGTGLNFLATLKNWHAINPGCSWHYIAIEKYPLTRLQLEKVYRHYKSAWPQLVDYCDMLIAHYPSFSATMSQINRFNIHLFDHKVQLTLMIGDVNRRLKGLINNSQETISAWYLDGFAPTKNPAMWQQEMFDSIAALSGPGTTISSYTAAGFVRRGLRQAGFAMAKAPGFGNKREMLYGTFEP